MIRKSIILAATAAALALGSLSAPALAAMPKTAPEAGAAQAKSPAEIYDMNHKGAVAMFTQFKTMITSQPEVTSLLAQLKTEMAGLPALEKAFIDAKNAGNEAAAKTAQDNYAASVQKVVELALPLDKGLMPIRAQLMGGFDRIDPAVAAKLKAEKDLAPLLADIDAALKPLDDANAIVGPMFEAAQKSAQTRMKQAAEKIMNEELAAQAGNALQQKLAQ
ncbi:MAG TPA: hypothetical protein V6C89_00635 [Drouetiella sp.]